MPKVKQEENLNELSVEELIKKRNEIIAFLQTLEDEHRAASITDESYNSAKNGNQKKLDQIRAALAEFGIGDNDGKPAEKKAEAKASQAQASPAQSQAAQSSPSAASPASPALPQPAAFAGVSEAAILEKVDAKLNTEMEKTKVLLDALKEGLTASDERAQRITEGIGELRSMLFNADSAVKSSESKLEILEENIAAVDPKTVEKEFLRRDKALSEHELRIEKIDRRLADAISTVKNLEGILTSVGGLHNISDIDHEITKKLEEIRNISKDTARTAERFEKMYIELSKRMDEFFIYRAKQESLDEIVRDVIKSIDTLNNRIETVATKENLSALRESFKSLESELDRVNTKFSRAMPFADLAVPRDLQDLSAERESIKMLLSSLAEEARTGKISKEEFVRVKEANEKKLVELEGKMLPLIGNAMPVETKAPAAPAPAAAPPAPAAPAAEAGKKEPEEKASVQAPEKMAEQPQAKPVAETKADEKAGEKLTPGALPVAKKAEVAPKKEEPPAASPVSANSPSKKDRLIMQLEDSFKSGHISKQAYEHAKVLIDKMSK